MTKFEWFKIPADLYDELDNFLQSEIDDFPNIEHIYDKKLLDDCKNLLERLRVEGEGVE